MPNSESRDPRSQEKNRQSYNSQLEQLAAIDQRVAEVASAGEKLKRQIDQIESQATYIIDQAIKALGVGREDLCLEALDRVKKVRNDISKLRNESAYLIIEERRLSLARERHYMKIEFFKQKYLES